jgi:predicted 2-oxoglutarate/Fe(II)-dependent dioxygenase YbiX
MNKNLQDYVLKFPNVLDNFLCDTLLNEVEQIKWKVNTLNNHQTKTHKSVSDGKDLDTSYDTVNSQNKLMKNLWLVIHKYIKEFLKFNWFNSWDGFSSLKFNRYRTNKLMKEHCDHIKSLFLGETRGIPILSIVGSLNNNYEGGEFIMFQDTEYKIKAGEVLIFPSNFLYPHKVLPVKKGTRYTYSSWVY